MVTNMRLHVKHLDPKMHGLIAEHKADKGYSSQEETIASLIRMAMIDYPERIRKLEKTIAEMKHTIER